MNSVARIQACLEILTKMNASRVPMDNTLRDYLQHRRYIGSKDRSAIVERVYRIVRHHARYGWMLQQVEMEISPRTLMFADMLTHGDYPNDFFIGGKHHPDELTPDELAQLEKLKTFKIENAPEAVQAECPPEAEEKLRALFGKDFARQCEAMQHAAPLDLRANTIKITRDKAYDLLNKEGVAVDKTPYSPDGLRAKDKAYMRETKGYSKGLVEIQDEGSQLIALVCGAKPGMRVLDYCAGGGGKTLGLAAMMENKGNLVAMDLDERRLEKARPRLRKAGIHNVELRGLSDEKNRKWLRRQKDMMDVVLVDAPCSSSGTWRRNPDLRWRQFGPSLEDIKVSQMEILERVADKVKPGGRLVYATCSLFAEENEEQVETFLSAHPEYKILPVKDAWPESAGNPPCEGNYLRLFPADHNTDGFFAAVLVRNVSI